MEYFFIAFIAIMVIGSIVSSVASMNKAKDAEQSNTTKKKTKAPSKKSTAKPKSYQPMTSHLNTDYSSRLTDLGSGDGIYDTVADIGDESGASTVGGQSLVDFSILYGDEQGNMDVGALATAIVLGEVLGAPKGTRK